MKGTTSTTKMKGLNVLDKVAMVFGQMNEPLATVSRVELTGLTDGRALP